MTGKKTERIEKESKLQQKRGKERTRLKGEGGAD